MNYYPQVGDNLTIYRAELGKACLGLPRPTPHLASGVGSIWDRPQTGARGRLAAG